MNEEAHATVWEHLTDLRAVLVRSLFSLALGMGVALYFSTDIVLFLKTLLPKELATLALFSPQEGMVTVFKMSFWTGVLFTAPYWLYEMLHFIAPALQKELKALLLPFIALSAFFVSLGITLCLGFTIPIANNYLFYFNQDLGVNLWGFSAYFHYVLLLLFAHAATFLLGAFLLLLVHLRLLRPEQLIDKRRHAIVLSLIIAALITPPDILTQIIVAVPLYGFFELAILYGKLRSLARSPNVN